jgi:hypothetical protein
VRGLDFEGGHIPGSRNLRTTLIRDEPLDFMEEAASRQVGHVVFTCMYSVMRAPQCASAVVHAIRGDPRKVWPKVSILTKGVHGWVNKWRGKGPFFKDYVKDFDEELWMPATNTVSECGLVHVLDVVWSSKGQQKLESALATLVGNHEVELEPEDDENNK